MPLVAHRDDEGHPLRPRHLLYHTLLTPWALAAVRMAGINFDYIIKARV
jgi:hypothetical protein